MGKGGIEGRNVGPSLIDVSNFSGMFSQIVDLAFVFMNLFFIPSEVEGITYSCNVEFQFFTTLYF